MALSIHTCMHIYMYETYLRSVSASTEIHAYIHTYIHTHADESQFHTLLHKLAEAYQHTHTHTHTHIYIYTHTQTNPSSARWYTSSPRRIRHAVSFSVYVKITLPRLLLKLRAGPSSISLKMTCFCPCLGEVCMHVCMYVGMHV